MPDLRQIAEDIRARKTDPDALEWLAGTLEEQAAVDDADPETGDADSGEGELPPTGTEEQG